MSDDPSPIVYVCDHVLAAEREVRLIVHHSDEQWQLTCGGADHSTDGASIRPVHLHHLIDATPALAKIMIQTPKGCLSERRDDSWALETHDD